VRSYFLNLSLILAGVLVTAGPAWTADQPIRVLYLHAKHGDDKGKLLEQLLEKIGGFQVHREDNSAKLLDLKREDYDVLLYYGGPKSDEASDRAIEKFVDAGGGVVALHHASAVGSKSWTQLLGARFAGHPPITELTVLIADDKHPITAGLKEFKITDEPYKHNLTNVQRHVVARFKDRPNDKDPKAAMANLDIVWTREVGKGRVVYCALGHGKAAWENPAWQKLVVQAICWAAGKPREIKLPQ
jgi:type 1 glutamine amidotransferase